MLSISVALLCVTRVGVRTVGSAPNVKNTFSVIEAYKIIYSGDGKPKKSMHTYSTIMTDSIMWTHVCI